VSEPAERELMLLVTEIAGILHRSLGGAWGNFRKS
jgi:hypothetical protein